MVWDVEFWAEIIQKNWITFWTSIAAVSLSRYIHENHGSLGTCWWWQELEGSWYTETHGWKSVAQNCQSGPSLCNLMLFVIIAWVCTCMHAGACIGQRRVSSSLELELQEDVKHCSFWKMYHERAWLVHRCWNKATCVSPDCSAQK